MSPVAERSRSQGVTEGKEEIKSCIKEDNEYKIEICRSTFSLPSFLAVKYSLTVELLSSSASSKMLLIYVLFFQ